MDQDVLAVHPDMHCHAVVLLVALLRLVHLRIPFVLLILGGAGGRDDDGIVDRALFHHHSVGLEVFPSPLRKSVRPDRSAPADAEMTSR